MAAARHAGHNRPTSHRAGRSAGTLPLGWPSWPCGQSEVEGGPVADAALRPGLSAMTFDDPLDAGQAYAVAREIPGIMQSLEWAKQLFHIVLPVR